MLHLPWFHPIAGHAQVNPGIILNQLAHRHLTRSGPIAFASLTESGMRCGGQFVPCSHLIHQFHDEGKIRQT